MADASRRLLIVGGAGYLGARLAAALTEYDEVWVTYRESVPERDRWIASQGGRIRGVVFNSLVTPHIPADGPFAAVLNLGLPSAAEAGRDPAGSRTAALQTTAACIAHVETGRAAKLLHFSTFHVFGTTPRAVYAETDAPSPSHPYGENHVAAERLVLDRLPARAVVARLTNVVAAPAHRHLGAQSRLLFLDLCRQAATENHLTLANDGRSYRNFVPFADVLSAVRMLLDSSALSTPVHLAGETTRLDAVATLIQGRAGAVLGRTPSIHYGNGTDSFRGSFQVSCVSLRRLGWSYSGNLERETDAAIEVYATA